MKFPFNSQKDDFWWTGRPYKNDDSPFSGSFTPDLKQFFPTED